MATTTPNFGWPVPTSTDLVKNGATAIEGLGDAIDASLLDLKGGTSGQVLAKASATDLDFSWVAQDDSNAIQNAIVDAKGDLIAATANDTPARLAVGTNGQILTADSTAATGLKWATAGGASFVGCKVYGSSTQSISNNTMTALTLWDSEYYDTDGIHSTSTNLDRFTVPTGKAGKWAIQANVLWQNNATGERRLRVYKNGTYQQDVRIHGFNNAGLTQNITNVFDLIVGDYLSLFVFQESGTSLTIDGSGEGTSFASVYYLGA